MPFSLYANLHSQTYGILTVTTFESARVRDFSPHAIFAVKWHRIFDLRYATFRSGRFSLSHFSQTMKSCRNLTCSHFNPNIPKSLRSFI